MVVLEVTQQLLSVSKETKQVAVHLDRHAVHVHMFAMDWLLTLFTHKYQRIASHMMDHFLHFHHLHYFYALVLGMVALSSKRVLRAPDFSSLMVVLCTLMGGGGRHLMVMEHCC